MRFDKLTRLLGNAFRPKPEYITITPVTASAPALAPSARPAGGR